MIYPSSQVKNKKKLSDSSLLDLFKVSHCQNVEDAKLLLHMVSRYYHSMEEKELNTRGHPHYKNDASIQNFNQF